MEKMKQFWIKTRNNEQFDNTASLKKPHTLLQQKEEAIID